MKFEHASVGVQYFHACVSEANSRLSAASHHARRIPKLSLESRALNGEAAKSISVGPGEERQLLELPLDTILMRDGMGSGDWRASGHVNLLKTRKGGFVVWAMF